MATDNGSFPYVDFNNDFISANDGDMLTAPISCADLVALNIGFFSALSEDDKPCLCYPKDTQQDDYTVTIDGYGMVSWEAFIGPRPVPPRPKP